MLTCSLADTVRGRAERDPGFAMALFHQAAENLLNGEAQTARLVLRELVNASVGFEALAADIRKPSKSLHRMLSMNGNPSMDNLAAIFGAIRRRLATAGELQVRQGDRSGGTSCS